jgi:hypothetical protein
MAVLPHQDDGFVLGVDAGPPGAQQMRPAVL